MNCPVCGAEIKMNLCHSKKKGEAIMLFCPVNGRHFRAFINEPKVVEEVSEFELSLEELLNWWQVQSS